MKRRSFLIGTGAVTVAVAGGGVWRAWDQGVFSTGAGPAYAPWYDWRDSMQEGPLALVHAAILAANPHNTQPWLFEITNDRIELYADISRNLGNFDPYLREMYLGLGCALENIQLAAAATGYKTRIHMYPGTLTNEARTVAPVPVARIELEAASTAKDPLFEQIPHRHTNRGRYIKERQVPAAVLAGLRELAEGDGQQRVFVFADASGRDRLGDLVVRATESIIEDTPMVHDSETWFRYQWSEIQDERDGVTLDTAGIPPLALALAKLLPAPDAHTSHQYWLEGTRDVHVATAPALGLIAVRSLYDKVETLEAGRLWQRMHLRATAEGLAMQPLNQPVELVDRERQLGDAPRTADELDAITANPAWRPTFAFRIGYPSAPANLSPRRAIESVRIRSGE